MMKMNKIIILLAALLVAVSQGVFAQRTITGKAINGEDGLGMPGVSVVVKGTTIGMITDRDGNFALRVPNNATIVVSFLGFKTVEIPLDGYSYTHFTVTLQPDAIALGDVVVTARRNNQRERVITAMGIERDPKTLPYAAYRVTGDEMKKYGARSIAEGLIGKVPGLNTYMGIDGLHISHLRSITSFTGAKPPLYIIDGIPLAEEPTWLNIEDIENITVLPSANAAMLYGSAGAGGAIVINTKRVRTISQSSQNSSSQRTIIGQVISEKDGFGMAGISVVVKGTTIATTTDKEGNFVLKVPKDAIIVVSFLGFKTVETPIENKSWYEITLQSEV